MEAPPAPSANVGLRVGAAAEVVAEAAVDPEVAVVGGGDNHDWKNGMMEYWQDGTIEHWNNGNTQYSSIPTFHHSLTRPSTLGK